MQFNRYTPVPPISSSDVTDSNIDTELEAEMERWKQRIEALSSTEDYDDVVTDTDSYIVLFDLLHTVGYKQVEEY